MERVPQETIMLQQLKGTIYNACTRMRERERESESEREWWRQLIFKGDRLETHTAFSFMKERDIYYI